MSSTLRLVLVGLLVLTALCACTHQIHLLKSGNNFAVLSSTTAVRVVKHAFGEVAVPLHPQRIVALHPNAAEVVSIFNMKLLGAPKKVVNRELIPFDTVDVGWTPNIEKVAALKPDLILGTLGWGIKDNYNLWSQIAPTFLDSMSNGGQWKEQFMQQATVLGKNEQAQEVVAHYNVRVAEFKQKMGVNSKKIKVSVVRVFPGMIYLLRKKAFIGVILEDLGIVIPPILNSNEKAFFKLEVNPLIYGIPSELLPLIDADALFVIVSGFNKETEFPKILQQLKAEPLWRKLRVVQHQKVYVVREYWIAGNYLSANRVLDDLFKYLVPIQSKVSF